jgi:uncharacterized protein (TIGR04255 family)
MPFPHADRVQYQKNPLEEVICQLRFPTILRIDTEIPSAYQERIRKIYPVLREKPRPDLAKSLPALPPDIARILGGDLSFHIANAAYDFVTSDDLWTASLTRDFISLTARRYETWQDFMAHLQEPLQALFDLYEPAFFARIGLRYQDVICRSRLGLAGVPWSELLQPHIAAELASPDVASDVEQTITQTVVILEQFDARVRIQHGLGRDAQTHESCYVIDSDFYTEARTETTDVRAVLDYFNRQAGRLFQWCIKPRLHNAMEPTVIS